MPSGLHIDKWIAGLHTNRAAISTPFRSAYGHVIQYRDALIDGSNVEITPANTLARRPGWSKYSSASYSGTANGLAGCDLNGVLHVMLSTSTNVYDVGASTITSIYTKGTTAQTFFQQVGNLLYMSDGNANKKWDGTFLTNNGVAAPTAAPTIPNLNLYDTVGHNQTTHCWSPGAVYNNTTSSPQQYYLEAPTGEIYWAVVPKGTSLQSQTSAPNWASQFGIIGGQITDGTMLWFNCGTILAWQASKGSSVYFNSGYVNPGNFSKQNTESTVNTSGIGGVNWTVGAPGAAHTASGTGTVTSNSLLLTGFGFAVPTGATIKGIVVNFDANSSLAGGTTDNNIQLLSLGSTIGTGKQQGQWFYSKNNSVFGTRTYGSNTDAWGATLTPTVVNDPSFGFEIIFNGTYGSFLVGTVVQNIKITIYYSVSASDVTGTAIASVILDSNGNLQRVKVLGTTGGSAPAWATAIGSTTTDNTMTWECIGTGNILPVLFGGNYAYGFTTTSSHISTMSALLTVVAPILGNNVAVSGFGSNDTQVVSCDIYRTPDGGSILLYDQSQPNVNAATSWTIFDNLPDTSLNALLQGPVAHANDPPPAGMTVICQYLGRMWGLVSNTQGNFIYFSAGPDCINGDGYQAWPPANVFTLTAPGTALAPTTQGLLVFTGIDITAILGGPQLNTFWPQPINKNLGVQSPNCLTQDGDEVVIYSSQQQAFALAPGNKNEFGFAVAPTLSNNFGAGTAYIAVHRMGADQGTFISDGSSKVMRYNMNAEAWDPIGTATNGVGPLASIDTAIGTRRLLSASGGFVLFRDTSTFSDAGTAYPAFATVGSLVVSEAGEEPGKIETFLLQNAAVGTQPTINVLVNEISGSFTNIPFSKQDPWRLPATTSIQQSCYDWKGVQSMLPNLLRHIQVQIVFATEAVKNEIFTLGAIPLEMP